MRPTIRPGWALALSLTAAPALWLASTLAQEPTTAPPATAIGSHQIDRFEAIRQLQADLRSDPNSLANWVILGEIAHEVAADIPADQDDLYYKISRDAYERALRLDPNNNGLRAAVQFARDQEANAPAFDAQRRRGVATYLEARRREIATHGANPTVQVYETPAYAPRPARGIEAPGTAANAQPAYPQPAYAQPVYRTYTDAQGQPLQYNQYSNGYVPPTAPANAPANANPNQAAPPTTLRQLGQQLPGAFLNDALRGAKPR